MSIQDRNGGRQQQVEVKDIPTPPEQMSPQIGGFSMPTFSRWWDDTKTVLIRAFEGIQATLNGLTDDIALLRGDVVELKKRPVGSGGTGCCDTIDASKVTGTLPADQMGDGYPYVKLSGKPDLSIIPPHTHPIPEVIDLQVNLDGKAPLVHAHPLAQISDMSPVARAFNAPLYPDEMLEVVGTPRFNDSTPPAGRVPLSELEAPSPSEVVQGISTSLSNITADATANVNTDPGYFSSIGGFIGGSGLIAAGDTGAIYSVVYTDDTGVSGNFIWVVTFNSQPSNCVLQVDTTYVGPPVTGYWRRQTGPYTPFTPEVKYRAATPPELLPLMGLTSIGTGLLTSQNPDDVQVAAQTIIPKFKERIPSVGANGVPVWTNLPIATTAEISYDGTKADLLSYLNGLTIPVSYDDVDFDDVGGSVRVLCCGAAPYYEQIICQPYYDSGNSTWVINPVESYTGPVNVVSGLTRSGIWDRAAGLGPNYTMVAGYVRGQYDAKSPSDTRTAIGAAAASHTHPPSDITGAGAATNDVLTWSGTAWIPQAPSGGGGGSTGDMLKSVYDPDADGKVVSAVNADAVPWSGVTGKPSTFAPSAHTHPQSEVTGLVAALAGKAPTSHTHTIAEISDASVVSKTWMYLSSIPAQRTHLGLGTAALQPSTAFAAASHTHTLANITDAGTAASKNFPASGDASSVQVVLGNDSRLTNARTPTSHSHIIADTTGLQTALDGKQPVGSYSVVGHTHIIADTFGLQTALDGKAPTSHTHTLSQISDATSLGRTLASSATAAAARLSIETLGFDTLADDHLPANWTIGNFAKWGPNGAFVQTTPSAVRTSIGAAAVSHTHALSDLTQSGAATGHVPSWNGSAWVPTSVSAVGGGDMLRITYDGNSDGKVNSADTADSVPWTGVTGKPSTFPPSAHSHVIADTTGLQTALDGKANVSHTHTVSQLSDATSWGRLFIQQTDPDGMRSFLSVLQYDDADPFSWATNAFGVWESFGLSGGAFVQKTPTEVRTIIGAAPTSHTHIIANTTGLQAALDAKSDVGHTHIIANVTGLQTALDGKAPNSHTHTVYQISDATSAGRDMVLAASPTAQRGLLGLGTAALVNVPASGNATSGEAVLGSDTRLTNTRTPTAHTHVIADTTGLQTALDGKAAVSHTHPLASLTQSSASTGQVPTWNGSAWVASTPSGTGDMLRSIYDPDLDGKVTASVDADAVPWTGVTGKPSTFPPGAHAHVIADTTGLQAALDAKSAIGHTHVIANISDVTSSGRDMVQAASPTAQRGLLGLGTAALVNVPASGNASGGEAVIATDTRLTNARTPTAHTHAIADTTGLQAALDGKAALSHTHTLAQVSDMSSEARGFNTELTVGDMRTRLGIPAFKETSPLVVGFAKWNYGESFYEVRTPAQTLSDIGGAAASHTHPLANITQSSATSGQVPTWNGSAWVPATPAPPGAGDMLRSTYDPDLDGKVVSAVNADAVPWTGVTGKPATFPPSAHTHVIADTTGLQAALDGKAATSHTHTASQISDSTTAGRDILLAASPSSQRSILGLGTAAEKNIAASGNAASGEVVMGNDSRLTDSRTPSAHTHTLSQVTDAGTAAAKNAPASGNASSVQVVLGNDTRLTDSRTPTVHGHVLADISDAGTAAAKNAPASGNASSVQVVLGDDTRLTNARTPTAHGHVLADISDAGSAASKQAPASGNATSTQVVLGNDTRLTDARTPTSHTHTLSALTQSGASNGQVPKWNGSVWAPANDDASGSAVPVGVITMWYGTYGTIPAGWQLCDGTGGTPDLRDKFVMGAGLTYNNTDVGGATQHLHYTHIVGAYNIYPSDGPAAFMPNPAYSGYADHLPPYRALYYIMKVS